jgi:hypothetical protein
LISTYLFQDVYLSHITISTEYVKNENGVSGQHIRGTSTRDFFRSATEQRHSLKIQTCSSVFGIVVALESIMQQGYLADRKLNKPNSVAEPILKDT